MLLSNRRKMLFIKGLKVGGTSVEVHLANQLDDDAIVTPIFPRVPQDRHRPRNFQIDPDTAFRNHMSAREVRDIVGPERFNSLHRWAVIRDPFEKVRSFYFMQWRRVGPHYSLDDAIRDCASERHRYCDDDGSILIQSMVRYEHLYEELAVLLPTFGLSAAGLDQVREKGGYRAAYTGPEIEFSPEQIAAIEAKFGFDLSFYETTLPSGRRPFVPPDIASHLLLLPKGDAHPPAAQGAILGD